MGWLDSAKTRVKVGSAYSKEFEEKGWCTSRNCAVATVVCNSCGCCSRNCKKECDQ